MLAEKTGIAGNKVNYKYFENLPNITKFSRTFYETTIYSE